MNPFGTPGFSRILKTIEAQRRLMEALLDSLLQLVEALWSTFLVVGTLLLPWTPLFAWIAFWTFGVNWVSLRRIIVHQGGWLGLVLLWFVMVLVWGTVAPPETGTHDLIVLKPSNYPGKMVFVTALFSIAFLCGSVQLSGCCAGWTPAQEEPVELDTHSPSTAH